MTDKPHPGAVDVGGELYLRDYKGNLVPITAIKAGDLLVDELVRGIIQRAKAMSDQLAAFRVESFAQIRRRPPGSRSRRRTRSALRRSARRPRWRRKAKYPRATIKGHRDYSPDRNGNGRIEPSEYIKACPSFDAVAEYRGL